MTITEQFKAKRCVFSIECFPPKQTTQMDKLKDTLRQMQAMDPGFISVTFGAGGSAGGVSTAEVADYIQNELHVPTLAHLICMGNDETRAAEILDQLESVGVRDVLALRGDRTPSRPESPDFKHASDLTSFIKWKKPEFSVHGACYPEGHPEADSLLHDVENLRIKQAAGAEHLLTQLFFDNIHFYRFLNLARRAGITLPVSAGVMPIVKRSQIERTVSLSSASLPSEFTRMISRYQDDPASLYDAGIDYAVRQLRDAATNYVRELDALTKDETVKAAIAGYFAVYDDLDASTPATEKLVAALESAKLTAEEQTIAQEILKRKKDLAKKTMWMYGGDGWAYDIGYGGLDHVFAMGEDVNVLLVDTEVYSNTGGQSSKATPVGAVAQFQASGKKTKKKDLGMLLMNYDNVYVAQCAMGANPGQLIKALKEAEVHKGPSIVICYAPCINHGIKRGMSGVQQEMKDAVASGYWNLYRYSPETKTFTLDSKEPTMPLYDFMKGEVRYASLELSFPDNAKVLFAEAEEAAQEKYESYRRKAEK